MSYPPAEKLLILAHGWLGVDCARAAGELLDVCLRGAPHRLSNT